MKLCLCDLDGVVVDASKRFARADEVKAAYQRGDAVGYDGYSAQDIYWRAALDPDYVHLDEAIDGANDALLQLQQVRGYKIVFLTSRPSAMKDATLEWLLAHLDAGIEWAVFLKAAGFQYVKTPIWKIGMAQTLIDLYGADEVIFVDDERAHWYEAQGVTCYSSLQAVFAPSTPVDDFDPFLPDFPD